MTSPLLTDEELYGPNPWQPPPAPVGPAYPAPQNPWQAAANTGLPVMQSIFRAAVQAYQAARDVAGRVSSLGPAGRTFEQIRGTDYLSDEERAWYLAQQGLAPAGAGVQPLAQAAPPGMELFNRATIFDFLPGVGTAPAIQVAAARERMPSMRAAPAEEPLPGVPAWAQAEMRRKLTERRRQEAEALSTRFLTPYLERAQEAAPAPSMGQFLGALDLPYTLGKATAQELGAPPAVSEAVGIAADLLFPVIGAPGAVAGAGRAIGRATQRYAGRAIQAAPLESAAVRTTGLQTLEPSPALAAGRRVRRPVAPQEPVVGAGAGRVMYHGTAAPEDISIVRAGSGVTPNRADAVKWAEIDRRARIAQGQPVGEPRVISVRGATTDLPKDATLARSMGARALVADTPVIPPRGAAVPPRPPVEPPPGVAPMSEGDATLALRTALREGKGIERAAIVARGRKSQAARVGGTLEEAEAAGLQGIELARAAGRAGAGKILPEGGIGFRLTDEAIDPLIDKGIKLQKEGKLSLFEAVYGVPKALDEGRRLGPTPAQARLLGKITDIDELEFAPYVRQRRAFDASSREAIATEVAKVGEGAPAQVRAQLQAAKRAELQAERASTLGKSEQAAALRTKAAEHRAKAEALQGVIEERQKLVEMRKLSTTLSHEVERRERAQVALSRFRDQTIESNRKALDDFRTAYVKRQARIEQLILRKTQKEIEAAQTAFDRAQALNPVQAAVKEQEASSRLISQLHPLDTSPERVRANADKAIRELSEQGISEAQARSALEVLRYHQQANDAILRSIKNAEGLGQSIASARAVISGDLADSYLTALMYRQMALGHALTEAGLDPALSRRVSNMMLNAELKTRFGTAVPRRLLDEIKRMGAAPYQDSLAGVDKLVQRWKNTVFGIDAGVAGVQVRTAARRGGVNVVAGMINKTLAMLSLPHVQTYADDVALSKRLRNILDGVHVGMGQSPVDLREGTLFSYLGPPGKALDDKLLAPLLDRINRVQFGNVLGWVGDNAYEGNLVILHLLGRDIKNPAVRAQAADISNTIKSFSRLALRSGRRGGERMLLTSSAMTRSQVSSLLQMSKVFRPGVSAEERILGATLIASQAVYYLTLGKFLNDQIGIRDFVFNPGESGFGQVTTGAKDSQGRNIVIDMVPQASLERAIGRSFEALKEGDEEAFTRAWLQYGTGRTSLVGRGTSALFGAGYSGTRGFVTDLTRRERILSIAPFPPIVSSALSEGIDFTRAALDFIGVSSFPESGFKSFERTLEDVSGRAFNDLTDPEIFALIEKQPELAAAYERWKDNPTSASAKLTREKYQALGEIATLAETDPAAYRRASGDIVFEYAAKREALIQQGIIKDGFEQEGIRGVISGYYDAIAPARKATGTDYDEMDRLGARYLATLDKATQKRVIAALAFSPDPTYRERLQARQALEPLFEAENQALRQFQDQVGRRAPAGSLAAQSLQFQSYDDFVKEVYRQARDAARNARVPEASLDYEARKAATKWLNDNKLSDSRQFYRAKVIYENPELMDYMRRWYPEQLAKYLLDAERQGRGR